MTRARAYKVSDFAKRNTADSTSPFGQTDAPKAVNPAFDLHMIGGLVEDFTEVASAIKFFPYKSAFSLVGFAAVLYIAFRLGTKFGIIQSNVKGKK